MSPKGLEVGKSERWIGIGDTISPKGPEVGKSEKWICVGNKNNHSDFPT